MSKHKFKVGDILVGNEEARIYRFTRPGVRVEVTDTLETYSASVEVKVLGDGEGRGKLCWVVPDYFDLVEEAETPLALTTDALMMAVGNAKDERDKAEASFKLALDKWSELQDALADRVSHLL